MNNHKQNTVLYRVQADSCTDNETDKPRIAYSVIRRCTHHRTRLFLIIPNDHVHEDRVYTTWVEEAATNWCNAANAVQAKVEAYNNERVS